MTERAFNIALRARLYRLLAERHEFSRADRGERIDVTSAEALPLPMSRLDSTLVEQADELDRLCGYAVRMLGRHRNAAVLDLLGMLDGDRIVALYYALPPARRHATLGDSTWAYYVGRAPKRHRRRACGGRGPRRANLNALAGGSRTFRPPGAPLPRRTVARPVVPRNRNRRKGA